MASTLKSALRSISPGREPNSGVYVLLLRLAHAEQITVGAMGRKSFPAGWYLYTGSAKRGMRQRVQRHFRRNKPHRWHIDYLTSTTAATPVGAVIVPDDRMTECSLNKLVAEHVGSQTPVPTFGASDCRSGCPAHLWYSPTLVKLQALVTLIGGSAFCLVAA